MKFPPSLRHRQFVIFWLGTIIGWIGNQVLVWAIPWHIHNFSDNPFALGAIGLIRLAPTIIFSLFAGVIADTFSRRKVVFITQGLMASTALIFAILTFTGSIKLWHIYILLAIHATTYVFGLPARYSITPNLVPGSDLPNALSVEFIGLMFGSLIGPILSGNLINHYGESMAYFVSAALFGFLLAALLLLGNVPQKNLKKTSTGIDWSSIKDGINFTFRHPLIFPSMLLDFMATLLTRADSLISLIAIDILDLNAVQYGWLSAASAIGAVTAGITLSQIKNIRRQGTVLVSAIIVIGFGAVVFGFSRSFPLSMAALILIGASDSVSSIIRSAIRQQHTSDSLRGRMTSVNQIFFMGGPYLGDVKSGFLGGIIGVPLAIGIGGIACIVSAAWIARKWPKLWAYDAVS